MNVPRPKPSPLPVYYVLADGRKPTICSGRMDALDTAARMDRAGFTGVRIQKLNQL